MFNWVILPTFARTLRDLQLSISASYFIIWLLPSNPNNGWGSSPSSLPTYRWCLVLPILLKNRPRVNPCCICNLGGWG